ncbi:MAG: YbaB/EbfC family nucleoid-associated protein [Deltaproteobacteria bacterium HGW-Deltaproteobacteria-11]|nr:MAG: YbaB/EbfC family nucleoid-associated protein [Deltaproteobacteria bacterium HGW-Deltaproteobacteria-11]
MLFPGGIRADRTGLFTKASINNEEDVLSVQNFGNIMKQAKKLQERMASLQNELALRTVEASTGGGMVSVLVNGKHELVSLKIEKEVVNPDDVEMLQDLILAAVNEGMRKAQEMAATEMAKITGGINIPGLT